MDFQTEKNEVNDGCAYGGECPAYPEWDAARQFNRISWYTISLK